VGELPARVLMPGGGHEPRIRFVIGGVQKAGTTALAQYLGRHPDLALPPQKEAHLFDDPEFDERSGPAAIDARYGHHFAGARPGALCGDATPIYLLHETLVSRVARYHPGMRWIVLLREPVARAISHYYMERGRGDERWPLFAAAAFEGRRLRGHEDDWAFASPLRHFSYRLRGDYRRQLATLRRHFPEDQILVLESEALAGDPTATLARITAFLGVAPFPGPVAAERVYVGSYRAPGPATQAWLRWLLRRERADYEALCTGGAAGARER
jgi:hypothetical protein